ncbi:TIGR01212 family radical SAM protein [Proteiniborus sp. MB09-C3]|uniref:TIGR01212 family radical SAM protein n=1 Tax=Proteiniborus sp. MB09-C3 TaxID=3050072 RepID=UPI002553EA7D|nr:TIGR01212 family radical SAM protein [Proteiniborus sp. MB09-C3]WIV12684.1 TIGR01212 family radical SAM protein [Proteiniborus sp. MB09-C3]
MMWGDKRYRSFNYEMKKTFKSKVIKLSLDGGFTCPNRDGTLGKRGCIFCGEEGSGEFAASRCLDIREQIESQKKLLSKKWDTGKYIAYFQNFTNTYSTYEDLKQKYYSAISQEGVVGLAIATRPDCLSENVMDLLEEINKKTFFWVELGLQTIHERTAKFIRRGYSLDCYDEAVRQLNKRNIKVATHLIFGLPNESREDILSSVKYVAATNTWGVKFHLLYIQKGTDLYESFKKSPFHILSKEEYISLIVDGIEYLPPDMVIHRLTGDGKRTLLVEPLWSLDKLRVLSEIDMELRRRDSYQGIKKVY